MALNQLLTARAAALFASDLPYQWHPGEAAMEAAISSALTVCGGVDGCVSALAAAYGDHPETAVPRMKWARQTIDAMRPQIDHSRLPREGFHDRHELPVRAPFRSRR